jgi:hypothetical protein
MFIQCCMLLNDFNKNTRNFATYSVSVFIQEQICLKIVYQNFRFQHYSHYAMFIIKNV